VPPLVRLPTPHQRAGRTAGSPGGIVLHTTDGSFAGTVAWFADPGSGVSAHYLVGLDGRVAQFVSDSDVAFHAGAEANEWTIGIEFEDLGSPEDVERTPAQLRAGADLLRELSRRWSIPLDRSKVLLHRELRSGKTCPGNLPVDALLEMATSVRTVCLLPVRNGAGLLPDWLASAARVADAVVALDDGSSDETAALLEASPLVVRLLRNPPRESFAGWDDGANRARLLEAALELAPDWILSLDVDERIPADDAAALRSFLTDGDALPGLAYGLRHLRVWGDGHDPTGHWVYRLFAPEPGDTFPPSKLHFTPIPDRIPDGARIRTTIRLQHVSASSPEEIEARAAKYREADPSGDWKTSYGGLDAPPATVVPGWPDRPKNLPVLAAPPRHEATRDAAEAVAATTALGEGPGPLPNPVSGEGPGPVPNPVLGEGPGPVPTANFGEGPGPVPSARLVALVAVRNGEEDLPGCLESLARFADGVVALDDGSTDGTRAILDGHPLVETVLSNPRRETYEGWDDAANRNRLLEAAAGLRPDWVLVLDADERIAADDALALRAFVDEEAEAGHAYGMRVYRMIGDLEHYDTAELWVFRLFPYADGDRFPDDRLHYVPVPTSIPRERWVRTTIRIQHLSSLTEERRAARYAKYREADPDLKFQGDYENLLRAPGALRDWAARPADLPVVSDLDLHGLDLDGPVLSAIVISRNDEDRIERAVGAVVGQQVPAPFEVIVVVSGTDRTADIVRERFPSVKLVVLEGEALPGRARNAGVNVARGDYISFPGSHTELPPGSLAARLAAHDQGHAMVTGTMRNGTRTLSGWASYFLDHSMSLPGRPSGALAGPPAHCSYARDLVLQVGGFPEDLRAGEDTIVNRALWRRGHGAFRAQTVVLTHHSRCTTPKRLVKHHFQRGRGLGRIMLADHASAPPLLNRRVLKRTGLQYLPDRLRRLDEAVAKWGGAEERAELRRARPLVVAGAVAAWAGAWYEILRPARGKVPVLVRDTRRPPVKQGV
jgi:glycosyltransferase involved in cell wall biosynthesis